MVFFVLHASEHYLISSSNFHIKYHQQLAPGLVEYKVSENKIHIIVKLFNDYIFFLVFDIHDIMLILSAISPLDMLALAAEN